MISAVFTGIKAAWFKLHPNHVWEDISASDDDPQERRCAVCGRHEEYDVGGGVTGPMWFLTQKGDNTPHPF